MQGPTSIVIVSGNMDSAAMWPIRQGDPDRVNYDTRYPVAQSVRDYFSHDVERTVDIGIEAPPIARAIEPALDPLATEDRGRLGRSVDRQWISVEEAGLTGIALFAHKNTDADQLCLIGQHRDEARVRHEW